MKLSQYIDKVWEGMDKMKDGEIFIIKDFVNPARVTNFIDAVKMYIELRRDWSQGYCLEFNDSYEKIRKTVLPDIGCDKKSNERLQDNAN